MRTYILKGTASVKKSAQLHWL